VPLGAYTADYVRAQVIQYAQVHGAVGDIVVEM
jgi:hypothetical protein